MTPGKFIEVFDIIAEAPGGIERLRELVLQLAVRGKLVPQDEGEEPASRLIEQIAEEKARLERAKEIGKQKPVLPMEVSAAAVELPSGWSWTCTAALGIVNPRNVGEDEAMVSFCPMPTIPTDYQGQVTPEIRRWGDIKKGYTHFADGDVVVAKITPCFQNRKSCVMKGLEGGIGAGTTELHVVRILASKVAPEYLLLFYKSPDFLQVGVERMTGTAGQQRVPREYFAYTPLPLPPLGEQHRIVAKVDELMGLIDRLEATRQSREDFRANARDSALAALRNAATSEEVGTAWTRIAERMEDLFTVPADLAALRESVLQLAVRGRLVPQDKGDEPVTELLDRIINEKRRREKWTKVRKLPPKIQEDDLPFGIPASWKWTHLGEITSYGATEKAEPGQVSKETWVLELEDIEKVSSRLINRVSYGMRPFKSTKNRFYKGDILYGKLRPYLDKVILADEDGVCSSEIMPIKGFAGLAPQFIRLVLKTPYFVQYANSSTHGMNLPRLGREKARQALFPLPPESEQRRIVAKVDELMGLIDRLEGCLVAKEETQGGFAAAVRQF